MSSRPQKITGVLYLTTEEDVESPREIHAEILLNVVGNTCHIEYRRNGEQLLALNAPWVPATGLLIPFVHQELLSWDGVVIQASPLEPVLLPLPEVER